MSRTMFTVWLDDETVPLKAGEVWPDGGAPADPTDEDVAREMRAGGSQAFVLREWNMLMGLDDIDPASCTVTVGPVEVWPLGATSRANPDREERA